MTPNSPNRLGAPLLRGALVGLGAFLAGAGGWIAWKAVENPDVRIRRPRSLAGADGFDHSFWIPLLLTVVVGSVLVGAVLWVALRRMRQGVDLYENRTGQGQRRRGERFADGET